MRKNQLCILPVILAALMVTGCSSEPPCHPDDLSSIIYTDSVPDLYITSVDSFSYNPYGGCYFPYNPIGTASLSLDVDGDADDDFLFTVTHQLNSSIITTSSCSYYHHFIQITATHAGDFVCSKLLGGEGSPRVAYYADSSEAIGHSLDFTASDIYLVYEPGFPSAPYYRIPEGKGYVGVQMHRNNETYFGWIGVRRGSYGFYIDDWAINTSGNCIRAGVH